MSSKKQETRCEAFGVEKKSKAISTELENIEKSASVITSNGEECIYCLSVIGQVEGHSLLDTTQKSTKYDHLIPLLVSLEQDAGVI